MDSTQYQMHSTGGSILGGLFGLLFMLVELALAAAALAGLWKTFIKMGHPGWAGIVPYYNVYLMIQALGKPILWFILFVIPCTCPFVYLFILIEFAPRFNKGTGFALGLFFLPFIFWPLLGFGDAKYLGPKPAQAAA